VTNVWPLSAGIPTTGPATIQIGSGPRLTFEELRDVLVAGGLPVQRAHMAAGSLLRGTTYPPIVQRTAADVVNEAEVRELREQRKFLLGLVTKRLSPLRLRALESLIGWHFASTLAEKIGTSHQHANNVCAALYEMGLLERKDAPSHLRGRNPWLYRTVDAVHGPEREAAALEGVRDAARKLRRG
jgi:predicted transcriptional regulator